MTKIMTRFLLALMLAWSATAPIHAVAQVEADPLGLGGITPEGRWIDDVGDAKYDVTLCGDGTQLCAQLTWIRPEAINERNSQYLGVFVVDHAKRAYPAEWRGDINVYGNTFGGSVKMLSQNQILVTGCFLVFCEKFHLFRVDETESA